MSSRLSLNLSLMIHFHFLCAGREPGSSAPISHAEAHKQACSRAHARTCPRTACKAIKPRHQPNRKDAYFSHFTSGHNVVCGRGHGPLLRKNADRRQDLPTLAEQFVQRVPRRDMQVFKRHAGIQETAACAGTGGHKPVRGERKPVSRPSRGVACCSESQTAGW